MTQAYRQSRSRRLRKQPKMRRVQSAAVATSPSLTVPKTARKRRRRNKRRFRWPTAVLKKFLFSARWVSLGLLIVSVSALVLIGLDEQFYLTLIPVEGVVSVPAVEIVEASGLASSHVFAADPNLAATRIAGIPGVISATVTLNWPNHVSIHILEDSPVAVWQEGNDRYWITKHGQLIPARTGTNGLLSIEYELPPVAVADTSVSVEESVEADVGPQASLAFIPDDVLNGAMMLQDLRPNIEKLYYRPSGGLSYQDGRGWRVYFGAGTDMEQKLTVYETIVEDLMAQELTPTYVSVSNQEKPYYLAR